MLYADKAALENRTKLRLLAIRERELTLYTQNCFTIGTVSALMAGLAYSSLLYTKMDYFQDASAFIQAMYVMGNVTSMYLALRAMTGTTMIAMFGPGKVRARGLRRALSPSRPRAALYSEAARRQALRGPDGSMHETVDGMLEEFEKAGAHFRSPLPIPLQGLALLRALASPPPRPHPHPSAPSRRASPSKAASTLSSSVSSSMRGARPHTPYSAC